ncbi:MAG TPA: GntR family transcriptional regulator [Jiangellaceae bacterium]|nr:GntR family transcriptional regulator [Jiangellaceae bacterium]
MTVTKTVLRDQVKDVITERILDGTYAPGERLVESQLAKEFGVSQAPIREALRDLEAIRFVESRPYRGARVRAVTKKELAEIYPVRAALEELAGQTAASLITDAQLTQLEDEHTAMRSAAEQQDVHQLLVHDVRFHEIIVEASRNTTLLEVWTSLRIEARTLVSVLKSDIDLPAIARTHVPVLNALRRRDADLAAKEIRQHLEAAGARVLGNDAL